MAGTVEVSAIELENPESLTHQVLSIDDNGNLITRLDDGRNP